MRCQARELVEGVDGDKDDVVVLIEELDHLLRTTVDVGLDQAGEFPDAVVDMHYIVADFDLVELL